MVCLHHNKESGKGNGFVIKECESNMFSNALKLFTFNLPIIVGLVKNSGENILLQTRQYTKVLDYGMDSSVYLKSFTFIPTFVTKGRKLLQIAKQKEDGKTAAEVGLINPKVQYILQSTKFSWNKKETQNINIGFTISTIPLLIKFPNPGLTAREAKRVSEFSEVYGSKVEDITQANQDLIMKGKEAEQELKSKKEEAELNYKHYNRRLE
jgi:hypothetical protein